MERMSSQILLFYTSEHFLEFKRINILSKTKVKYSSFDEKGMTA